MFIHVVHRDIVNIVSCNNEYMRWRPRCFELGPPDRANGFAVYQYRNLLTKMAVRGKSHGLQSSSLVEQFEI